jgi:uncharacterized membrane protein (UPF0127 family)
MRDQEVMLKRVFIALLVLSVATLCYAQSAPLEDLANFPKTSVQITSGKQRHQFAVWVADTPPREEQGLMFVHDLPVDQGMLFPQTVPRRMTMWMKNTYIELDMVFVGTDGHIARIVEHAVPLSLATIDSGSPIEAVLEIKGGETGRLGLHVGDEVTWNK